MFARKIRTPWHLKVLYISTFILRLSFGALLIVLSNYVPGANSYERLLNVAIVAVPYPLAEMITANYFGIKSDRIGRKLIIVGGTSVAAIVVAGYALSNNIWFLATLHGIHGIGAAATVAPAIAMIADHADHRDRGRQMGWFDYSTLLGYIFGAVLGGFAIELIGNIQSLLLIAGLLFFSAFLLWRFVLKETPKSESAHYGNWNELRKVFKIKEVRQIFPIWLIIAILLGLALTYLPIILLSSGIRGGMIGIMFALAGGALGLLQPFWGKVSDRIGRIPVMIYGVLSITGIMMMLLLFPDSIYSRTEDTIHFGLGVIPLGIFGIGAGAFIPSALALMADSTAESSFGATMGLYSFALGFGAFVAEAMGLALIVLSGNENAPSWIMYFAAILVFIALALILFFFSRRMVDKIFRRYTRSRD